MKNITILILTIILSFGTLAQESFSALLPDMATDGIVRGDKNGQFVVSYCKVNGTGRFTLADISSVHGYQIVDPKWDILDFQIVGDKVVFCGTITETCYSPDPPGWVYCKRGLIGFINIADLNNSSTASYYAFLDNTVMRFKKVAALNSNTCLYAIGEQDIQTPIIFNGNVIGYYTGHATCVYVVDGWTGIPNLSLYSVTKYGITGVDLTDLSATDNYVVAVGDSVGNSTSMGLYLARFSGTPNIDEERYYKMKDEPLSDYHSIGINDDHVFVSCLAGVSEAFSTNIHVVDLNSMYMVNSQQMPLENKAEPSELAHILQDNTVVMQQYMPLPSNPTTYKSLHIRIDPFQTTMYNTFGFYHSVHEHSSLGSMAGKYAIGFNGFHWIAKNMMVPNATICYKIENIRVNPMESVLPKPVNWLYDDYKWHDYLQPNPSYSPIPNIDVYCTNQ